MASFTVAQPSTSLTVSGQPNTLSRSDRTLTNASIHTPSSWRTSVTDPDVFDPVLRPPAAGNEGAGEHETLLQSQQPQPIFHRSESVRILVFVSLTDNSLPCNLGVFQQQCSEIQTYSVH